MGNRKQIDAQNTPLEDYSYGRKKQRNYVTDFINFGSVRGKKGVNCFSSKNKGEIFAG